jgi:carboxymethylenebutenolidase
VLDGAAAAPSAPEVEGLTTAMVEYPGPDGATLSGYLARPEGDEAYPAVVVIQEWWGVDDHIKDIANRFAEAGYVALAPDLYHGQVATEPDEARKLVMALDMEAAVAEIQSGIDYLLEEPFVTGDQVGTIGFCMGGGLSLRTALADDRLGAAVAFYGSPLSPEEAANVKAPILGLYGGQDQGIPVAGVEAMGEALTDTGVDNEIHVYEDAQHAFFNDTRASSYHADAAADAWDRTLNWFATHLAS